MTRPCVVPPLALAFLLSCTTSQTETPRQREVRVITPGKLDAVEAAALRSEMRAPSRAQIIGASELLARATMKGAKTYFTSAQMEGKEPWHNGQLNFPVSWNDYTFPGGASFVLTTHDSVPTNGEPLAVTLDTSEPWIAATLASHAGDLRRHIPRRDHHARSCHPRVRVNLKERSTGGGRPSYFLKTNTSWLVVMPSSSRA